MDVDSLISETHLTQPASVKYVSLQEGKHNNNNKNST